MVYINNEYKGKGMSVASAYDNTDIESVSVWKGDSVPAEYGEDGRKNGIIFIYTKDYTGSQGSALPKAEVVTVEAKKIIVESKDGKKAEFQNRVHP